MKSKTITPQQKTTDAVFVINVKKAATFDIGTDESYNLSIEKNTIRLEAATSIGALRGLATLQQLLQKDTGGYSFPVVSVSDNPRFKWRGLMIDVARHFIPPDVLRRNIDAMYAVKLNVLHLHLTDDEGFRIESKQFPGLHLQGSDGQFYTQEQMKDLIRYARLRGIMIVPEFDMPGHTRSWFAAYPQLASAPGPYTPGPRFDISGSKDGTINLASVLTAPTPTIDPTRETTYQFLDRFFGEMAALFPSPYIHIGADENNGVAWKNNAGITAFMAAKKIKTTADLQAYFVSRMHQIIAKHKKQLIGWEELFHAGVPKDIIVQKWIAESPFMKGHGSPEEITAAGNSVIMSQGFYLDLFMPAYIHYNNPGIPKNPIDKFLGGEGAMWTEVADGGNFERRVWPRAAVIAERLWSSENLTDVDDMYLRMYNVSKQLDEAGLAHLSSYDRALRRLTSNDETPALKTLVDILVPPRGYRHLFGRIKNPAHLLNNQAAFISVCDWITSDSEVRLAFRKNVAEFLSSKSASAAERINVQLRAWAGNHDILVSSGMYSSSYKEVAQHSKNLKTLAEIGISAVNNMLSGKTFPENELAVIRNVLKESAADHGNSFLGIVPEIESLVNQKLVPEPAQYSIF